jgi:cobalt-zinc-cadmium efflux system outer membrane protein
LRDAEARLAAARRIPALRAGAGVRRLEGPDEEALVFELAMPLPVFDRNQGGIAEAEARQLKTKAERRAEETRLLSLLFGLYQELKHADTELEILQSEVLPHARATASLASAGYLAGRYSYLDLADAQRTLMDARESSLRAALSYHELLLETERLLGEPLQ